MEYLIENDLVSYVRVVDKVPPQTAWLNGKHQKIFEHPLVEFRSANLINPGNLIIFQNSNLIVIELQCIYF